MPLTIDNPPAFLSGSGPVLQYSLDLGRVFPVPLTIDHLTTIRLPVPIQGLEGLFVSPEPDPPSRFQISFRPGEAFFSIRALQTNATGNLNVVLPDGMLALNLYATNAPAFVLNFSQPSSNNLPDSTSDFEHSTNNRLTANPTVSSAFSRPSILPARPGIPPQNLETTNAIALFRRVRFWENNGVQPISPEVTAWCPSRIHKTRGGPALVLRGIYWFHDQDLCVFRVDLLPQPGIRPVFLREDFSIRSRSQLWTPSEIQREQRDDNSLSFCLALSGVSAEVSRVHDPLVEFTISVRCSLSTN